MQEIKYIYTNNFKSIGEAVKYNWRERTGTMHKLSGHLSAFLDGLFTCLNQTFIQRELDFLYLELPIQFI